jgi:hypothetical protein
MSNQIKVVIRAVSSDVDGDAAFITYYSILKIYPNSKFFLTVKGSKKIFHWTKSASVITKFVENYDEIDTKSGNLIHCNAGNILLRPNLIENSNISDYENNIFLIMNENKTIYGQPSLSKIDSENVTPFVDIYDWMTNLYDGSRINTLNQGFGDLKFKFGESTSNQMLFCKLIPSCTLIHRNYVSRFL